MTKDYRSFAQGFLQGCLYECTEKHKSFLAAIDANYLIYVSQDDEIEGKLESESSGEKNVKEYNEENFLPECFEAGYYYGAKQHTFQHAKAGVVRHITPEEIATPLTQQGWLGNTENDTLSHA